MDAAVPALTFPPAIPHGAPCAPASGRERTAPVIATESAVQLRAAAGLAPQGVRIHQTTQNKGA